MTLNRFLAALVLSLAAFSPLAAVADAPLGVGKPAPAIDLENLERQEVLAHAVQRQAGLRQLFASWCQPCKLELPFIVKQYPALKSKTVFLGIDELESPSRVAPFAKQMGIAYPILIDPGSVGSAYQIDTLPKSVFIDRHGVVQAIWRGYMTPAIFKKNMDLITASQ